MRVLILSGRAPVALDHARRFRAQGAQVFVADSLSGRLSSASRDVQGFFRLPSPRENTRGFADELARIVSANRIDLVLPTCEEVFYLARVRALLPRECQVFVAPFDVLRELHSKLRFQELAAGCGAHTPRSHRVSSLGEAREWACGQPVVLKPEFSRFGVHVRMFPGGIPADDCATRPLASLGAWVVQEMCTGRELCSYSIAVNGALRAHVAYEPAYRLARSSSFYFDPVDSPPIQEFVRRFVRKMNFTGQISFDWMLGDSSKPSVLECNPRAVSGLHLFSRTDPLPAAILGNADDCIVPARPAARMLAAVMATAGLAQALSRGQFARWRSDWLRATDVLIAPGDYAPLAASLVDLGSFAMTAIRQRRSLREASTRDIEWDGEPLSP